MENLKYVAASVKGCNKHLNPHKWWRLLSYCLCKYCNLGLKGIGLCVLINKIGIKEKICLCYLSLQVSSSISLSVEHLFRKKILVLQPRRHYCGKIIFSSFRFCQHSHLSVNSGINQFSQLFCFQSLAQGTLLSLGSTLGGITLKKCKSGA